jgi:16S rRNA (uracil1498-N3)-methyltransferase
MVSPYILVDMRSSSRFLFTDIKTKFGDVYESSSFWVNDQDLFHQWTRVLRLTVGDAVVLFDGAGWDRLYEIEEIDVHGVKLKLITTLEPVKAEREVYLFWSLLKKDKNEWVVQKATELGVSHLVPIISERTEKTGYDIARMKKIAQEASEQCGRSILPTLREPIKLETALKEYSDKLIFYVAERNDKAVPSEDDAKPRGVLIGPEGGWSRAELELILASGAKHLHLGAMMLRAETAAIVASSKLV